MTLIAFSGKLGSGKDTAGERLAAMVAVPATQISFARPLKESAAALLDIPVEDWEKYKNDPEVTIALIAGWDSFDMGEYTSGIPSNSMCDEPKIVKQFTAREFLQRYGTESHRHVFGEDFWVTQALGNYWNDLHSFTYVTDCRFENEASAVQKVGGVVVRVVGANDETGDHPSEAPLPDELINFEIVNTVRDDGFRNLDTQLRTLAAYMGLSLKKEELI